VCCLSFKFPEGKILTVIGKIKGSISKRMIGSKGFGYDPIFIPFSKPITFAQMPKFQKIKIDHRYIAFKKMKKKLKLYKFFI
jgi:XTP/dITP diphosphohydrolase